jgi:lysozyme family protein
VTDTQYSPDFLKAVEIVLEHEGGYSNARGDAGGETKFGISKREYPNVDIANLTRDDVIAIYCIGRSNVLGNVGKPGT